jgi:hypothetical protein
MPTSDSPTRQELEQLLRNLGPEVARIFQRHRVSEEEAQLYVGEALAELARKWGRVKNRERWFLRAVAERATALPRTPPR